MLTQLRGAGNGKETKENKTNSWWRMPPPDLTTSDPSYYLLVHGNTIIIHIKVFLFLPSSLKAPRKDHIYLWEHSKMFNIRQATIYKDEQRKRTKDIRILQKKRVNPRNQPNIPQLQQVYYNVKEKGLGEMLKRMFHVWVYISQGVKKQPSKIWKKWLFADLKLPCRQ